MPLTMPTARHNSTPSVSQNKLENWSGSRAVTCPSVHTILKSKPNDQGLLCFFPSSVTLIYSALFLPFKRGNLLKNEILVLLCLPLNFQGNILIMSVFHCGKECTMLCWTGLNTCIQTSLGCLKKLGWVINVLAESPPLPSQMVLELGPWNLQRTQLQLVCCLSQPLYKSSTDPTYLLCNYTSAHRSATISVSGLTPKSYVDLRKQRLLIKTCQHFTQMSNRDSLHFISKGNFTVSLQYSAKACFLASIQHHDLETQWQFRWFRPFVLPN